VAKVGELAAGVAALGPEARIGRAGGGLLEAELLVQAREREPVRARFGEERVDPNLPAASGGGRRCYSELAVEPFDLILESVVSEAQPLMHLRGSVVATNRWKPNELSIYEDRVE
jgi:hypothetical protein